MRETSGYSSRHSNFALVLLVALAFGWGVGCGDDGDGVSLDGGETATTATASPGAGSYRLAPGGNALVDAAGTRIPIDPKLVTGYVDAAQETGSYLDMSGWAAPAALNQPADAIVAVVGNKSVLAVKPSRERPDLVEGYNRAGLRRAGFVFSLPRSALRCSAPRRGLKTFAVAGDAAAPLQWLADVGQKVDDAC